ncbi:hypothetical protein K457DRAFT_1899225 [Linnemannia elongata AG-77]|uniref:Tc1-like transposase DDE domain-containing protein n=1 Tax=Linnemannia elongata AG-77 TaxID=1314771 RepID=A0A197JH07_9FUNG|nr:hypothetical protein K457DRAFT_1899225 [Linnemannia elongata AG-77]
MTSGLKAIPVAARANEDPAALTQKRIDIRFAAPHSGLAPLTSSSIVYKRVENSSIVDVIGLEIRTYLADFVHPSRKGVLVDRDRLLCHTPTNDYHGNFSALLFDSLFTRICKNFQGMGLNNCRIYLDGASYHFHKTAAKPARDAKMPDLREWAKWPDTIYAIAKQYGGHVIRKTPPYHCELQPIENIWACVKNKVAALTNGLHTSLSLKRTLISLFFSIPESTLLRVWNESIKGIQYWTAAEMEKAE